MKSFNFKVSPNKELLFVIVPKGVKDIQVHGFSRNNNLLYYEKDGYAVNDRFDFEISFINLYSKTKEEDLKKNFPYMEGYDTESYPIYGYTITDTHSVVFDSRKDCLDYVVKIRCKDLTDKEDLIILTVDK